MFDGDSGYIDSSNVDFSHDKTQEVSEDSENKKHEQKFKEALINSRVDDAKKIQTTFNLLAEFVNSEVQQQVQKIFLYVLEYPTSNKFEGSSVKVDGLIRELSEIKKIFNLPEEFINSSETQKTIQKIISICFENRKFDLISELIDNFNISEELFYQAAQEAFLNLIKSNQFSPFFDINDIKLAFEIQKQFHFPDELTQPAIKESFLYWLKERNRDDFNDDSVGPALKIKEIFNLSEEFINSPEVQQIVQEMFLFCLKNGYIDSALKIKQTFNLPEEFVQQAVLERLNDYLMLRSVYEALQIKKTFSLPEEAIQSSFQDGFIYVLKTNQVNLVETIAKNIIFSNKTKSNIFSIIENKDNENNSWFGHLEVKEAKKYLFLAKSILTPEDKEYFDQLADSGEYQEFSSDPIILAQFEHLKELAGEKAWKKLFSRLDFWGNLQDNTLHDNLLFVQTLEGLSMEEQKQIGQLILTPFLSQIKDFSELNDLLKSFSLSIYQEKHEGELPPFANYDAFVREANLQKYNIKIPENASEDFAHAIELLIQAKGVDVNFLRAILDVYQNGNVQNSNYDNENQGEENTWDYYNDTDYQSQEAFIKKLIDIIEGRSSIDQEKLIAPYKEEMPFDPIYALVFNALGIYSLNQATPRLSPHAKNPESLGRIYNLLQVFDKDNLEKLKEARGAALEQDRKENHGDKQARIRADFDKRADSLLITKNPLTSSAEIVTRNIEDLQYLLSEEQYQKVNQKLEQTLTQFPEIKEVAVNLLLDFATKKEVVEKMLDLLPFLSLQDQAEALQTLYQKKLAQLQTQTSNQETNSPKLDKDTQRQLQAQAKQEISTQELLQILGEQKVNFVLLLLYFGLNNQTRQSQSLEFKKSLDQILNQEKYKKESKNPTLDYVNGALSIHSQDEEMIKELLTKYGYNFSGRTLELKIASGSDYTAWTCGDQTDCCMPFNSEKNQEYLLRPDTSYFVISITDKYGNQEIIAQSVLVKGVDKNNPDTDIIAFDNIEIANRAIQYRPIIAEAYQKMKDALIERFQREKLQTGKKRLQLLIGTTYSDDGGLITGNCSLQDITSLQPVNGELSYSDCFGHSQAYVFYDSQESLSPIKFYGLQKDMLSRSKIKQIVKDAQTMERLTKLLDTIGQGEDDGDGGLSFPDNFSAVIAESGEAKGYVIAANYLTKEGEADFVVFEELGFTSNLSLEDKTKLIDEYLKSRQFDHNDEIDGIKVKQEAFPIAQRFLILNPNLHQEIQPNGDVLIRVGKQEE